MSRFRKLPVVVEASQFWPDQKPWPNGVHLAACNRDSTTPHIHTLEGPLNVSPGDWIITGVDGEKYPVKPDIFKKTYEPENE